MNEKIFLDFAGAAHGHFLEYVINSWIGQRVRLPRIFTKLGTCHLPAKNTEYKNNRMIVCGHYSEHNIKVDAPDKVIRIIVESELEFYIYRLNLLFRPGDIGLEKSINNMNLSAHDSTLELRKNVYAKLIDPYIAFNHNIEWKWETVPQFEFPMESLFDQITFYSTLTECAKFLNHRFIPDVDLFQKWNKFMELNQGYQIYSKSKKIVENVLNQNFLAIDTTAIEQACVNTMLTKVLGIYDGPLFEHETYPDTTLGIWQHVRQYLEDFDKRF